ncbi:MAG: DHH family phosphoesterase, partial [Cyanobacteria bacterium J06641_5]
MPPSLPNQRWQFADVPTKDIAAVAKVTGLPELLARVLVDRGIDTPERALVHLDPERQELLPPEEAFDDLGKSVDLLVEAIENEEKIAICGDYDADGMTSTALLLRALRALGADIDYAIPSRMHEGYGINTRIVEEFAAAGVGVILTVDNGIAAHEAVRRAVELGLTVIITDHHDLPELLPPADAILNPKLLPSASPYACLAGVGVAYILAIATAEALQVPPGLRANVLDLFTLGTIADLAPLQGINRQWLRRGLAHLPQSQLPGIQALIASSGVKDKDIKPEDIGFRLGPRINAIGRIGEPQVVIEL